MKEKRHIMRSNIKVNAVLNFIKTLSSIIFPLITFPYISRVLLPDNIGKLNFASSFASYFSLIATLGITTYAIRECAANRDNSKKLEETASQIFSINLCTTFIAYLLLFITIIFFRRLDSYRTLIIIQSLTILSTTVGCDWLNSAMEDFGYITLRTISFQILSLILMFVFVKCPDDYIKYAVISIVSSSGANIANAFYRRKYCKVRFVTNMGWDKHFKSILLLFVMILAQTIFNSSDITMLGLMEGNYSVGLYSTAVKMSNLVSQVVASLAWVVMPRMSLYFTNGDFKKINSMLRKMLNFLISIGLPVAIGVVCISSELITIIAGSDYVLASNCLRILMLSFVFSLFGGSFLGNMVLLPSKKEDLYMKVCCISTIVNLVLNYFFIPIYGINAAAGATAFSSLLILILLIVTKDKRIRIDNLKSLVIGPIIGSTIIIIICGVIKSVFENLFMKTFLCCMVSSVLYFIIQIIFKNELCIDILNKIRQKLHF